MRKRLFKLTALVLLGVRWAFPLDPQKKIGDFVHTAWTEKDGAPDEVRALAQTKDGYLWIGTTAGLFRFDGMSFSTVDMRDPGFGGQRRVLQLLATDDGSLWAVFVNGIVSRVRDRKVTAFTPANGLPRALHLVESPEGVLLAGTIDGMCRFVNNHWEKVDQEWNFPTKRLWQLFYDKTGTRWGATESQIIYLLPGQDRFVDAGYPIGGTAVFGYPMGRTGNFAEAPDGSIWLADIGRSAHTVLRAGDYKPQTEIRVGAMCLLFDRAGSLWIGSAGDGIRRVAFPQVIEGHSITEFGPEAEQFTSVDGLSSNYVRAVLEDREGNIWWGTRYGIDRFRESAFTTVPIPHPDIPTSVLACKDGEIWRYSSNSTGASQINLPGLPEVVHATVVAATCLAGGGILYANSGADFLDRFTNGHLMPIREPPGMGLHSVASLTTDQTGGVWMLDRQKGVFRMANGVITQILGNTGTAEDWGTLYTDSRDRVWIGQMSRLSLYDHGRLQSFDNSMGAPHGPVFAFLEDRSKNLWAAADGGLREFKKGRFRAPPIASGFPAEVIYGMAEDNDQQFWMNTNVGVVRIPVHDLDRAMDNPGSRVHYRIFDSEDGLPGTVRNSFPMPTLSRGPDGRIWFAATRGIAYVDPKKLPKNPVPPPVLVNSVIIGNKEWPTSAGLTFSHQQNNLEIRYTALSFSVPQRVRFRYRLEGKDTEWVDAGTRRSAFYTGLPPKDYTFHVVACNDQGVWNTIGASWKFRIIPAFYQTEWFQALWVLAGVLLLAAAYRLRVRQMRAIMNTRFNERLAERTRLARDLHDTLLQTVQASRGLAELSLSQPADANQLHSAMERLFNWLTRATDEGRAALRSLRMTDLEGCGLAEGLRRAGEECQNDSSIQFVLDLKGSYREIHPVIRDEVYRIGYEAIRNACFHSEATSLQVELVYGDQLVLRVRDNGKGIEPETARHGKQSHFGIAGMYERAAQIRGHLTVSSTAQTGTEVALSVSGNVAFVRPKLDPFRFVQRLGLGFRRKTT